MKKKTNKVNSKTFNAVSNPKGPGRNQNHTEEELKQIALDVKNKYNGRKLTYLFLETETGIGRQTWSRRMAATIKELNSPSSRRIGLTDSDEVYFPNIQHLFDVYGKNHNKLIQELQNVQDTFYELYDKYKYYKSEVDKKNNYKKELESKIKELDEAKQYKQLYFNIAISSTFQHLRKDLGISDNVLNFEKDIKQNTSLTDLEAFFPNNENEVAATSEQSSQTTNKRKINLSILKKLAPDVLDSNEQHDE